MIGTPDELQRPPNGLIRRDSYNDIASDSEMDEPFFNFDSEEMDDEELYCESLLEELKKQQVWRKDLLFKPEFVSVGKFVKYLFNLRGVYLTSV